jgi:hypothetical protein
MRGKKLELEHFLGQHGIDIFLLCETFLNPGQAFQLANTAQTEEQLVAARLYWSGVA